MSSAATAGISTGVAVGPPGGRADVASSCTIDTPPVSFTSSGVTAAS